MSKLTVRQQIQYYLNGRLSRLELHKWAYDMLPSALEDAMTLGDEDEALGFLVGTLAEYDHDIEYVGFSEAKATEEFHQSLNAYLLRSMPRPSSHENTTMSKSSKSRRVNHPIPNRPRSRKGLSAYTASRPNSRHRINKVVRVA